MLGGQEAKGARERPGRAPAVKRQEAEGPSDSGEGWG